MLASGTRRKRLLAVSILAGSAIGLVRVVEGGHFLSDVIFSGLFVYFAARISFNLIFKE